MADRGKLLLALAYLGALAWVAYEWQRPLPMPSSSAQAAVLEHKPLPLPRNQMAPLATFDEMIRRPPFVAGRRPVADDDATTKEAAATPTDTRKLTSMRLSAILNDNKQMTALVEHGDGKAVTLREGSELEGWKVNEIQDDHIVLALGGRRREMFVYRFDAPPPPGLPRPTKTNEGGRTPAGPVLQTARRPPPLRPR